MLIHHNHTHPHTAFRNTYPNIYLLFNQFFPQVTYNTEESDFTEMGSLPVIKRIVEDDGETAEEEEEIPEDESEDLEPVWS
jgi:hypothetical protein